MSATKATARRGDAAAKADADYRKLIADTGARNLDVGAMITAEPAPRDYLFGAWSLVAGTTGVLFAPGDSGKSYLALSILATLACAGAAGVSYDPLLIQPKQAVGGWKCLYVTGEDSESEVWHRIYRVGSAAGRSGREAIGQNLRVVSTQGLRGRLLVTDDRMRELVVAGGTDRRLIVFDTLTRFHERDENSNAEMAAVIARFESIALDTGAAVLILHHCNKTSMSEGTTAASVAIRGAGAIRDNCRWALAVSSVNTLKVLHEDKHNDGRGHDDIYACWSETDGAGPFVACGAPGKANVSEHAATYKPWMRDVAQEGDDENW